jgi:hypothetical protein
MAIACRLVSVQSAQVFDLPIEGSILTPEWTDNEHVSILRTAFLIRPSAVVGSINTGITVSQAKTLKVREKDSASSIDNYAERECGGRWAAATASGATEAVWWKQESRWLPCFESSGNGPLISSGSNTGPTLELPGAALGTMPDGRFVYTPTNLPKPGTVMIDSWSPQSADVQHLGRVTFPTNTEIFSAMMSPNGKLICWITYDYNESDIPGGLISRLTRTVRPFTSKQFPAVCLVAWLSNADGSNLHAVIRKQEPGSISSKFITECDEYMGPTGDEITWSCDSKFFAFIRGNPYGNRQLYVCKAD